MTPEERYRAEMLRTALNAIRLDADGLAAGSVLPVEAAVTATWCDEIESSTRLETDLDAQAWHRAAVATARLLRGEREPAVVEAWVSAQAELPPMEWRKAPQ